MNAKKKRDKNRRRARRAAEQAWEAADASEIHLAVKMIRRAVGFDPGNPALWNEQGLLLRRADDDGLAADSFEAAICLAPDFAEAYANLADIRAQQGKLSQAVCLQRQAVAHRSDVELYHHRLNAYESLAEAGDGVARPIETAGDSNKSVNGTTPDFDVRFGDLVSHIEQLDWASIAAELTQCGYVCLPELLDPDRCGEMRAMFDKSVLFSKTVSMNKTRFGRGVYRYFESPVPELVDCIRHVVYANAVPIVNEWQRRLDRNELYPNCWSEFRLRCADAGQTTPSPLMLHYEVDGFNALHQDLRGDVYFPLQLVIVLSPRQLDDRQCGFRGGEFLFCDEPERKKSDRRVIPAGLGDAVLFCTRERLVPVAGLYGLKAVKHGMQRITSGIRYAVGIPFHEFA